MHVIETNVDNRGVMKLSLKVGTRNAAILSYIIYDNNVIVMTELHISLL